MGLDTGSLHRRLAEFSAGNALGRSRNASAALVITRYIKTEGLPLSPEKLRKGPGGQVLGLDQTSGRAILKRLGLAAARDYVALLNDLALDGPVDLGAAQDFWIERVRQVFADKPLQIDFGQSLGLRTVVASVMNEAERRQKSIPGAHYASAVLQHLLGALVDCTLGCGRVEHNRCSITDASNVRVGHFLVGDAILHTATFVHESLIGICRENLIGGRRPVIVTIRRYLEAAEWIVAEAGLGDRVDVFDIEQFVALGLYHSGSFSADGRRLALKNFVTRYNEIVAEFEPDSSMKIKLRRRRKPPTDAA
jgi:hypothetical protein